MGAGGTDVARESADMVLLDNNFVSLIEAVRLGRGMFDNLRKFVYYVFTHNWAELMTFVAFVLLQVPLPLLVVQVLAIDLAMDVLPSLALTMEPPEPDVMKKPPRRTGRLIDARILSRALYVGVIISIVSLFWAFRGWMLTGWTFGQMTLNDPQVYAKGTTIVMAGIVAGQLGNLFSARSSSESAFRMNPFRNKWLLVGILSQIAILLALVYAPFLQSLFETAPLSIGDWIFLYSIAPLVILVEEFRKTIRRRL
jgi:magnesium-transporting ATPase (P-type)